MASLPKSIFFFLILFFNFNFIVAEEDDDNNLMSVLEEKFHNKLSECTNYVAKWLEDFNDKHLGNSDLGRILHYEDLKPKFGMASQSSRTGKNMKKMGVAMIPLIFHVGATSTWMLLTSIMAAKSVAIGLALLVFKIAVSSAKVASFFTALKAKHSHESYSSPWSPHFEHHGYDRSLSDTGSSYYPADWNSYSPEVNDVSAPYKTIPMYKSHEPSYEDMEYSHSNEKKSRS